MKVFLVILYIRNKLRLSFSLVAFVAFVAFVDFVETAHARHSPNTFGSALA